MPNLEQLRAERSGGKWVKSVVAYLEWRAGLPWIAYARFRFHPEVENYMLAIRAVNFAWTEPEPTAKKLSEIRRAA